MSASAAPTLDLGRIGGSDIAAVAGISPWRDSWSVWARIVHGLVGDTEKEELLWGKLLEEPIGQETIRRYGLKGRWAKGQSHLIGDALRVTPDLVELEHEQDLLEIKNTGSWAPWDDVPDYYEAQAHFQMTLLRRARCHFGVLFGGHRLAHYVVEYDEEIGAMLVEIALRFWRDHVVTGRPPPVTGSDDCRRITSSRYSSTTGVVRTATPEEAELIRSRCALKRIGKTIEAQKKLIDNRLLDAIGPDYGLEGDSGRLIAPTVRGKSSTDWEAVVHDLEAHVDAATLQSIIQAKTTRSHGGRQLRGGE